MTSRERDAIIGCAGLVSGGLVAASGHDGWGWILFITFIMVAN
jgi:hypothetical protein